MNTAPVNLITKLLYDCDATSMSAVAMTTAFANIQLITVYEGAKHAGYLRLILVDAFQRAN